VADVDSLAEDLNAVTLLTLHAAKGLEYPVVFITGLEEGLLPHMRSFDEPDEMAEERRLMYVGLTRAKLRVYLSYAFRRLIYGDSSPGFPSRFLADIPAEIVEGLSPRLMQDRARQSYQNETNWDRPQLSEGQRAVRAGITPFNPSVGAQHVAPKNDLQFRAGQKVRHAKFGDGIVVMSQRSGSDEEVTVSFKDKTVGIKRLAASFANLQIVGE
jgi:DNA helicase-2/ATP-dependent DNA helicase PcrA